MTQKGAHTWDLNIHYYRCPKCGFIIEDRQGGNEKEITCGRCTHHFSEKRTSKKSMLPLFTDAQPVEWDWN